MRAAGGHRSEGALRASLLRWTLGGVLSLLAWVGEARAYLINEWEHIEIIGATREEAVKAEPGKNWKEPLSGMEFLWVEGGCFHLGSPPRIEGRDGDEGPVRRVCLAGYWIGRKEVSQGEWRKVMRSNPAHFRKGDDYPLERVTWVEAESFVRKLNEMYPGKINFRLPTEAEWEYACRDKGQAVRFAGAADPAEVGWFADNSGSSTQMIASRMPNRMGLFDMSGNVWEWMRDSYQGNAYAKMETENPVMENSSVYKVIRGGSWTSEGRSLRCSNRGFEAFSSKRNDLGLRLVRVIDTTEKKRMDLRELTPF